MRLILGKIKKFFFDHEPKIILALGLVLVGGVAFESGFLKGKSAEISPLVIEKPAESFQNEPGSQANVAASQNTGAANAEVSGAKTESVAATERSDPEKKSCVFVGSKNSNKYHVPTCRYAKLIKPENIICFSSAEDAAAKGYLPDKSCVK